LEGDRAIQKSRPRQPPQLKEIVMSAPRVRFAAAATAALALGSALPAANALPAQAHTRVARPASASVRFLPAYTQRTALAGRVSQYEVLERVYTPFAIRGAHVVLHRLDRGISARVLYAPHGLFRAHSTHNVLLYVRVPRTTGPGLYIADLRLRGLNQAGREVDFGAPYFFTVRVARPAPPRPGVSFIHWTPASLGAITVDRGQTLSETASFVSSADLRGVRVFRGLGDYAQASGLNIRILSTPLQGSRLPANTPVSVTFQIHAGPYARIASYAANLHVFATLDGSHGYGERRLANDLAFRVDVDRGPVPTATNTATAIPATTTATNTATAIPATTTATDTATAVPATATSTSVPATATSTSNPATATSTSVPATATSTSTPATATSTSTSTPATATSTSTPATPSVTTTP